MIDAGDPGTKAEDVDAEAAGTEGVGVRWTGGEECL